jgi:hypothetical protein
VVVDLSLKSEREIEKTGRKKPGEKNRVKKTGVARAVVFRE